MENRKEPFFNDKQKDELLESALLNSLFEGLAEGAGLSPQEARRAMMIMMIHNTADFILNNIFEYFFAADQARGVLLHLHLLNDLDFLKKANTLKKCGIIENSLFKTLAKLNEMRVAIAHGKDKNDPRLEYKGANILLANAKVLTTLDDETVEKLLQINEKLRRIRIFKDKWPEKPFINELHDKDRK